MASAGDRVSEYVLEAAVGEGTHGTVWRARHHVWADQVVAVKIPTDSSYVRVLQREGVTVHGLQHPNIVRAIGFDPYASPPYLVMEYVPGGSLRARVKGRPLTPGAVTAVMRQVLAGLGHAHGAGMVHRDLKPENVLVHEKVDSDPAGFAAPGAVKLTDFGFGQAAAATPRAGSIAYSTAGAAEDAVAGTVDYMSPEQRRGEPLDGRSDLYACGVMWFELLTGEKPAGSEMPSDVNRALGPGFDEVFRRSYTRLERRFASAGEMAAAIEAGGGPQGKKGPPPLPWERAGAMGGAAASVERAWRAGPVGCPRCRGQVDGRDQFCMHCGMQLVDRPARCGSCGGYPGPADAFCLMCGVDLAAPRGVAGGR